MTTYNGWSNWETWNLNLWIENDEFLNKEKNRFVGRNHTLTEDNVKKFVMEELLPNGTPDFDSINDYKKVDWEEIANHWTEEE